MYAKAGMFLLIGFGCLGLILLEATSWRVAVLCLLMVWAFCRAYYFAFYVIEKYIDPGYRFSGLIDFLKYVTTKRSGRGDE